tara:strand:+ start:326 stop:793 length:468 start_codon:yes stop_codon:yes gene_type:complete
MYLPPCKVFLKKRFKNFDKNFVAQMWVLKNTYFDSKFYYNNNPDLHTNFKKDDYDGLYSHFILNGWEEGRFPFNVKVDDVFYRLNYEDVQNFPGSCQEHFTKHGYKEGRLPYMPSLELKKYNQQLFLQNPNSKKIMNNKEMYEHYLESGYHDLIA